MPDSPSFVVNDRRKFTADGDLRPDAQPSAPAASPEPGTAAEPQRVTEFPSAPASRPDELSDLPESSAFGEDFTGFDPSAGGEDQPEFPESSGLYGDETLPPGPTAEQAEEATRAYNATVERLDIAMRASDPGGERMPEMNFERLTQSLYTQTLLLLGGATQPGDTPRVDILGARQTIDMLSILSEKTKGNLSTDEDKLLQSALFDLQMGFLEITQALARQARQAAPGAPGAMPGGAGPRIVR